MRKTMGSIRGSLKGLFRSGFVNRSMMRVICKNKVEMIRTVLIVKKKWPISAGLNLAKS